MIGIDILTDPATLPGRVLSAVRLWLGRALP